VGAEPTFLQTARKTHSSKRNIFSLILMSALFKTVNTIPLLVPTSAPSSDRFSALMKSG